MLCVLHIGLNVVVVHHVNIGVYACTIQLHGYFRVGEERHDGGQHSGTASTSCLTGLARRRVSWTLALVLKYTFPPTWALAQGHETLPEMRKA